MTWVLKMEDATIESGLVHDFDASLSGIGQELGAGAYSMSDVLALPIFKQEDSSLPPETETKNPPFQYVLCAATSPAVKLHDETLTYLNQGQSYEVRLLDNRNPGELPELNNKLVKSIVRVVFHDRRLQYTEHQQLEGWKWNRPGDRLLDIDIPMSVGIVEPKTHPSQLNAAEFLWDLNKRASVFVQVHCISTEFTPRKHGGEKGVPFRIQIDAIDVQSPGGQSNSDEVDGNDFPEQVCEVPLFDKRASGRSFLYGRADLSSPTQVPTLLPSWFSALSRGGLSGHRSNSLIGRSLLSGLASQAEGGRLSGVSWSPPSPSLQDEATIHTVLVGGQEPVNLEKANDDQGSAAPLANQSSSENDVKPEALEDD